MRSRMMLLALLLLAAAAPALEDEGRVYFSLNTDRPVRPGEQAVVRVQAQGVKSLEFRLYRVNDPFTFFRKLDDPHQFGSANVQRAPAARTTLEKFAAWKRKWRSRYREVFRHQFSEENRHAIRAWMTGKPARQPEQRAQPKGIEFAGVPVLNEQQVVRKWSEPVMAKNRWEPVNVQVEVKDKGLYVLEATDQKKQAYTLISATDLVLITKATEGRVLVRAVDRASGEGVTGAALQVYDWVRKADVARDQTGVDGLFETRVENPPDEGLLVMAKRGADFAMTTVNGYQMSTDARHNLTGYVYTDRPVYRPGHKVEFKSILRVQRASEYQLPDQSSAQVKVEDGEGKTLLQKNIRLTKLGTLAGSVELPADAALGYYSINVSLDAEEGSGGAYGGFHVEEYRKPDYEVKVQPETKRVLQGSPVKATIDARYYYGEPVAGAKVTWVVHRYRYWPAWWEMDEGFGGGEDGDFEGGYGGEQISEEEGQLDADGKLTVTVPVQRGEYDYTYRVEARVTDSSNRAISGAGSFLATRGNFLLVARPEKWVYAPGETARMIVETRDYEGAPVGDVPFRLEVSRHRSRANVPFEALLAREGRTGKDGKSTVEFPAPEGGSYEVRVSAANPLGGEIREMAWLWVSGTWATEGAAEAQIRIVPDKSTYKTGETAKVLVATGVPECDVWVSLEGKELYWSKVLRVKGGSTVVEVPVQGKYAPNVFLEAVFVKNNTLYRGSKALKVPPVEKQIQVELSSSKPEYKPGEPAVLTVAAKDHAGRPVEAEFSVGVVDEAIYAIKREAQPDIVNVFYGRQWNRVGTETSLNYYFYGEAGKRRMQLALASRPGTRAQLKREQITGPKIRKNFPDTAFWVADLKTGADGRAQVEFSYPDSLTTWRATARGVTASTMVGGAVHRDVVRKDVLVTIAAPRFFTEGDETVLPVLVRNYTQTEQRARVSLQAQGVDIIGGSDGEVRIAPRGEGRIDYRVRAGAASKAVLTAKALAGAESDALEITLPVEPYGLKITRADQKRLDGETASHNFGFTFPADAGPRWRQVSVRLTPSVAGAVFGALEYLITYPYGCTEQTMSSFLPNVIVAQALKELNLPSAVNAAELGRKVNAGLERLYGFQHEDGGWGWWRDDDSDPFMTAYVTLGLQQAQAAGYKVQPWRIDQAREWLVKRLGAGAKLQPDTRAYLVYALAVGEKPAAKLVDAAWQARDEMTPFGWAVLGLALNKWKDGRAAEAVSALERLAKHEGEEVYWPSNRDPMIDFPSDNSLEATAFAVKFLAGRGEGGALVDGAAQWLVNHRDQGYYWSSTKRTAFVVYGLTDVLKRSGELRPDYRLRVTMNGKEVFSRKFGAEDALKPQPVVVRIPVEGSGAQVQVEKSGAGRLYASANWEYRSSGETQGARALPDSNPLRIERRYYRLTPQQAGGRVTYQLEPVTGELKPGDLVAAHLRVQGGTDERYLLVEDPLPAGAETLPNDQLYELRGRPAWWSLWWARRESRDARVTWYPYALPRQGLDLVYLMRVTNAGTFRVAPARVEPMYTPGTVSWSEAARLEVKP